MAQPSLPIVVLQVPRRLLAHLESRWEKKATDSCKAWVVTPFFLATPVSNCSGRTEACTSTLLKLPIDKEGKISWNLKVALRFAPTVPLSRQIGRASCRERV